MIKAVLFDLDGTIADSLYDLAYNANKVLKNFGYPTHKVEKYKMFVGNGIARMLECALPEGKKSELEKLKPQFMENYNKTCCDNTKRYDGVIELIDALKQNGVKIAVVTNKQQPMAEKVVEKLYPNRFDVICGYVEGRPAKPNPAGAFYAMEKLDVKPQECIFLGDSDVDINCGINCNAYPCGVLWGFRTKSELINAGAKSVIEKPMQLLDIINKLN